MLLQAQPTTLEAKKCCTPTPMGCSSKQPSATSTSVHNRLATPSSLPTGQSATLKPRGLSCWGHDPPWATSADLLVELPGWSKLGHLHRSWMAQWAWIARDNCQELGAISKARQKSQWSKCRRSKASWTPRATKVVTKNGSSKRVQQSVHTSHLHRSGLYSSH